VRVSAFALTLTADLHRQLEFVAQDRPLISLKAQSQAQTMSPREFTLVYRRIVGNVYRKSTDLSSASA
jgi:hypothetical protein